MKETRIETDVHLTRNASYTRLTDVPFQHLQRTRSRRTQQKREYAISTYVVPVSLFIRSFFAFLSYFLRFVQALDFSVALRAHSTTQKKERKKIKKKK